MGKSDLEDSIFKVWGEKTFRNMGVRVVKSAKEKLRNARTKINLAILPSALDVCIHDTFFNYIVTSFIALGSLPLPLHRQYNFQVKDHGKKNVILVY